MNIFGIASNPSKVNADSKTVDLLIESLKNHDKWECDRHTLDHSRGVKLWVSSGERGLSIFRPDEVTFSRPDQKKIWQAVMPCIDSAKKRNSERLVNLLK